MASVCKVLVTQPRIISAYSVAARVARERGEWMPKRTDERRNREEVVNDRTVGYQVRTVTCGSIIYLAKNA
jgi:HrpA-like RNA helicase